MKFARACAGYAKPEKAGTTVEISFHGYLGRIAKQALVHCCAVSQPGFTEYYHGMRKFLLEKETVKLPSPFHLWCYLLANKGGRSSGVLGTVILASGQPRLLIEFSFWPLGWILTFDDLPIPGTLQVTNWCTSQYNEKKQEKTPIPCNWALTAYPLDFRSPTAIQHERRMARST